MNILLRIIIVAVALMASAYVIPGIQVSNVYVALGAALILGIMNAFVRPVLVILTLPLTIVTFGLFVFVINALMFWLTASLLSGFVVSGFFAALIGSLFVSIVSAFVYKILT
jgi:putative membrane protein